MLSSSVASLHVSPAPASAPSSGFRNISRLNAVSGSSRTLRIARVFAATALTGLCMQGAFAANLYVDGKYGWDGNNGSRYSAFKSVWKAWSKARPGDTVYLLPTTTYGPIWLGGKSGYAGKPITLKGYGTGSNMTKVSGQYKKSGIMIEKGKRYINIENLNVTAPGHGSYAGHSAIHLLGNQHITIRGNYVHNSGCAGIQTMHSDYVTISNNRVAYNAKDTYKNIFCSGISNHENLDSDSNTGVKMRITNNVVYGNTNKRWSGCKWPCTHSDGNGIIIDDTRRTQTDYRKYRGRTLIQNNIIAGNGGRGVHIYSSDKVDVFNNTLYMNNRDPYVGAWRPGEVMVLESADVKIYNNIAHTDGHYISKHTGERVSIAVQQSAKVAVDYNLVFNSRYDWENRFNTRWNGSGVHVGSNNRFGNPKFRNPGTDLSWADMRIKSDSAAYTFSAPWYTVPSTDFLNQKRTGAVTAGAYEY